MCLSHPSTSLREATALLYAAHHGNHALVDLLSGPLGADIEAVDANGFTALILAVLTDR